MIAAIKRGYVQGEISKRAHEVEQKIASGDIVEVGHNKFASKEKKPKKVTLFQLDPETAQKQKERLSRVKKERDLSQVQKRLAELKKVAQGNENILPATIEAVKAYCTIGEVSTILKEVFGEYREQTLI